MDPAARPLTRGRVRAAARRRFQSVVKRKASMKFAMSAAMVAFGLGCSALFAPMATGQLASQPAENLRSNNITFDYLEPRNPAYWGIYERMKNRQVWEEFSQFLSPLRLPVTFRLKSKECGTVNAFYENDNSWAFLMCYEFVESLEKNAPKTTTPDGLTRGEFIAGSFVSVVLHETGHAFSDILKLPVLGREEDTADQISGFVMLQFGKEVARATIKGTYFQWMRSTAFENQFYWDVHSTNRQRAQNYLCLGYGSDPDTFRDLVQKGFLPKGRAENCAREYREVASAFRKTIMPYIDEDLMKEVQAKRWFRPQDFE
jgi:hypothetical protein